MNEPVQTQPRSGWLRRLFAQPAFIVVSLILFVAAAGLNGATEFMQLHFRKQAVPLTRELKDLPEQLGPWRQMSIDEPLDADTEHTLGTDNYVFRHYVDTRLLTQRELDEFTDKSPRQRMDLLAKLSLLKPRAVVNISLTYYTGLVDTVAHVPDRCFVADGFEPTHVDVEKWNALKGRKGDESLRYIVFEDQTPGRGSMSRNVAYFFNCNGEYMNDPIGVRRRLAYLFEEYGYYMKIETHVAKLSPAEAAEVMNDLLAHALPEIEKCLPDWQTLTSSGGGSK